MDMMGVRCRGRRCLLSWRGASEVFVLGSWIGCLDISKITSIVCRDSMGLAHLSKKWYGRYDRLEELPESQLPL
jgi:hypothetical protein